MKMKKLIVLLLALVMILALAACGQPAGKPEAGDGKGQAEEAPLAFDPNELTVADLAKLEYGKDKDYISLYEKFGKQVTIDDVTEDTDTGLAYATVEGKKYELGMDFLSMAMVYNTAVPEGSAYKSEEDVYAAWWKLYIQRWNHLLPEIPLYSNEYYDVYNAQIKGVEEHPTNPFWGLAKALLDWTSEKADKDIILGDTTELGGKFRFAYFGANNPAASDNDISFLVNGLETVVSTKEGSLEVNKTVVKNLKQTVNEDGSKTFEIEIDQGLKFSDGSEVKAVNYLPYLLTFSSPVGAGAAGKDHRVGLQIVGFEDFNKYTGPESKEGAKEFKGVRLLGDYKFSVTIDAEFIPYFYDISYAAFSPTVLPLWLDKNEIKDDGNGCYLSDSFYDMVEDKNPEKKEDKKEEGKEEQAGPIMKYVMADHIKASARNTDETYAYSGAYVVKKYDDTDKSVILEKNPNFKGNYEGVVPAIEKVTYKKIISETQLEDFKSGGVDLLAGITGGTATNEAITAADKSEGKFAYVHYSRAGYGKLGFRADFGPVQFAEVRQAIAYCMDRAQFAKDFTGGYGGVVDGPYYKDAWMNKAAVENGMQLNAYAASADTAIQVLEEGGWVFDKDGKEYKEGVRYKKIEASRISENDITFQSKDGKYKTVKVGEDYYMPLVLNWYGTVNNDFTDLLVTGFLENDNMAKAGFAVQQQVGDFTPMLDELYQANVYGFYSGTPMYTCFNFATGFNSAVYDFAYNWTIDPAKYDDLSICYLKDLADVYMLSNEEAPAAEKSAEEAPASEAPTETAKP